ncbi:uncharacterized protein LOC113474298 [Ciona intestinalis]
MILLSVLGYIAHAQNVDFTDEWIRRNHINRADPTMRFLLNHCRVNYVDSEVVTPGLHWWNARFTCRNINEKSEISTVICGTCRRGYELKVVTCLSKLTPRPGFPLMTSSQTLTSSQTITSPSVKVHIPVACYCIKRRNNSRATGFKLSYQ